MSNDLGAAERSVGGQTIAGSVNAGVSAAYRFIRGIVLVVIVVALTLFAVQNWTTLDVYFLSWSLRAPVAALIFGIFALGVVFGFILHAFGRRR